MKRVFYDTSVFLLGLLSAEAPFDRLFRLDPSRFELVLSDAMFTEVLDVVRRSATFQRTLPSVTGISLQDVFSCLQAEVPSLPASMRLNICAEEHDNKFLSSAMYLECDYLVTQVPDLLELESKAKWLEFKRKNGVSVEVVDVAHFAALHGD